MYRAVVQGDGSLQWNLAGALPQPLYRVSAVVAATGVSPARLYVVGGAANATTRSDKVYSIALDAQGVLSGTWTTVSLPGAREYAPAVIYQNHLAVIGGRDSAGAVVNTVWAAELGPDGSLGAWQTDPAQLAVLPVTIFGHAATVVDVPGCGQVMWC